MATAKERAFLLDEFQNNTGTERHEAQVILNSESYFFSKPLNCSCAHVFYF